MSYQNDNIDYHSKYLKYKKKYLDLQSKIEGGATPSFEEIVKQVESKLKTFDANLKKKGWAGADIDFKNTNNRYPGLDTATITLPEIESLIAIVQYMNDQKIVNKASENAKVFLSKKGLKNMTKFLELLTEIRKRFNEHVFGLKLRNIKVIEKVGSEYPIMKPFVWLSNNTKGTSPAGGWMKADKFNAVAVGIHRLLDDLNSRIGSIFGKLNVWTRWATEMNNKKGFDNIPNYKRDEYVAMKTKFEEGKENLVELLKNMDGQYPESKKYKFGGRSYTSKSLTKK